MSKGLTIIDKDYAQWVEELCKRYRRSQIKAAVKVNQEMLRFYWELGRDIVEMKVEQRWGEKVIMTLSADLKQAIPGATGFSRINLYYMKRFYSLYSKFISIVPQLGEQLTSNSGVSLWNNFRLRFQNVWLADIYPTDFRSSMPTIEEIEARIGEMTSKKQTTKDENGTKEG